MIQLQERHTPGHFALFYLGFRPFFLGGAIAALLLILSWLLVYTQQLQPGYYNSGVNWHAHEMLFGFTLAIIAGFLLTAVRNWTSQQTAHGTPLIGLFLVWLAGRLLPWLPGVPDIAVAAVDLSFLPLVILGIALPILRSGNYRNLIFVPLLGVFWIANLLMHLEMLGYSQATAPTGITLGLFLVVTIMTLLGGRVIPFFTERGVAGVQCQRFAWVEKPLLPLTVLWLAISLTEFYWLQLITAGLLALLNMIRVAGWFDRRILSQPLVWILQLGYSFIGLGFALYLLALVQQLPLSVALHAFAVGGVGCLTLGMMARVSLGHTARPLKVSRGISAAFLLLGLSALVRVSLPWLPMDYVQGLTLAGMLWSLGWLLFLVRYLPILIQPRADGLYG